jgi:hypothetical protein
MDAHYVGDLHVKETQEDDCGDLAGFSAFSKAPTGNGCKLKKSWLSSGLFAEICSAAWA